MAVLLAGAVGAAAALPASAGAHHRSASRNQTKQAAPRFFGYNGVFNFPRTPLRTVLTEMKAGGANTTRLMIPWSRAQPRRHGGYRFHFFDRVYHRILASGIRPLIVPIDSPCWAHPSVPCGAPYNAVRPDRRYLGQWRRFMAKLARRYRRARGFEIWNEPNLYGFWGPDPSPRRYERLLRAAAKGVRSIHRHPPIAFGGPAPIGNWRGFIRHAYQRGAGRYSDDLALHLYPRRVPVARSIVQEAREANVIRAHYDPNAGMWGTEVGVSTAKKPAWQPRVDPSRQAEALVNIYHRLARRGFELLTIFRLRDPPRGQFPRQSWQTGLGVEHTNGRPKPAFCALAVAVRGGVPKRCGAGAHRH